MRKFSALDAIRDYLMLACPGIERDPESLDFWTAKILQAVAVPAEKLATILEGAARARNGGGRPPEMPKPVYCDDIESYFPRQTWLSWTAQSSGHEAGSVSWTEKWMESEVSRGVVTLITSEDYVPQVVRWTECGPDRFFEAMEASLVEARATEYGLAATYEVKVKAWARRAEAI